MNKNTFANQYNIRVSNQLQFISFLKERPQSLTDLAVKTGVSFTAAVKVMDELIDNGIAKVCKSVTPEKKKGRTPVLYEINCDSAVTCAVDLSHQDVVIAIASLTNQVIVSKVIEGLDTIPISAYHFISDAIKELLASKEVNGRALKEICISVPGFVNKQTGQLGLSSRIIESDITTPQEHLSSIFQVPVATYNDVQIAAVGEKVFGCIPADGDVFLYVHMGKDCGAALLINGRLYQGHSGYSGEFSTIVGESPKEQHAGNWISGLKDLANDAMSMDPSLVLFKNGTHLLRDEIKRLYEEKNPAILKALDNNARSNAVQFIYYSDFLDLQYIVLEGAFIKIFGDEYKKLICKYTKELNTKPFSARILYSTLDMAPSLLGSVYLASNLYFLHKSEDISEKRIYLNKCNLNDIFGESI